MELHCSRDVQEVKLKLIATGDFEACLTSTKLKVFFTNLSSKQMYLHISTLNLLYYSLVDIVDSAPIPKSLSPFINSFKTALYRACRANITTVIPILYKYRYPNVQHEKLKDFVDEFMASIQNFKTDSEVGYSLEKLHELLTLGANENNLPFITNEEDHMLINGLMSLYTRPIYMYINSEHIFDNEGEIKEQLSDFPLLKEGKQLTNFRFLDSKDDKLIQVCDITVGLIGKFFTFINTNSLQDIRQKISNMANIQLENLDLLLRMFEKTFSFNEGLVHYSDTFDTQIKISEIGKLRSINLG